MPFEPSRNERPIAKQPSGITGRLVRLIVATVIVVALAWAGLSWMLAGRQAADVLTATAAQGELVLTVVERGEVESAQSVQVLCEVEGGGKLASIVAEGTKVKKGQEVARFDIDTLLKTVNEQEVKWEQADGKVKASRSELEVQKNKAESEISKADLALILANIDRQSYEEGEYQVEVDRRKGTLELSKKDLKEAEDALAFTRGMVKNGFAQLEQIRGMELQADGKRYAVGQQEADLRVYEKFTKLRKTTELKAKADEALRELERTKKSQAAAVEKIANELKGAEKTATLEKRQLERLRKQIDQCVIKAPEDGILIYSMYRPWDESSRIRVGATLHYQQPIFTLPDLNHMQVSLKVHESVVKKVQKGQPVTMQIEAHSNQVLHGKVKYVATLSQNDGWRGGGVKEYKTEVTIDDLPPEAGLRPGMTAEVKILIKTVPDAITVPVQAVTEADGKYICYVVTGSAVERRVVRVGESNQQLIQILEGVSPGDRVALDARVRTAMEMKGQEHKDGSKKGPDAKKEPAVKQPVSSGK